MTIIEPTLASVDAVNGFAAFNLPHALYKSLEHMKYTSPTPVQAQAIPAAMKGKDVIGSAQTGTGKTGAFVIPILARLMTDMHSSALIMTPTRELATQILTVARQMLHQNNTIKTALLIGGESMGRQRAQIAARPRLIIGTPGRINDHLRSRSNLFATVNILVLDEADRMLDMGFTPQINEVIKCMPSKERQTLMYSATFPDAIIKFTKLYMKDPVRVTIEPERTSAANIIHETINTSEKTRYDDLMNELHNRKGTIIMFIKTKHGADRIGKKLEGDGHSVVVIHGGLSQRQRDRAIAAFRNKTSRIMVATDVAARGLDVPHIEHVINYDLPQVAEDYIHRIGRTARAGAEGRALSFLMPSEKGKWNAIQRILNPGVKIERDRSEGRSNSGGSRGNGSGNGGGGNRNGSFKQKQREFRPREDRDFEQAPRSNNFRDKSHLIDPPMSASAAAAASANAHAPRSNDDFNSKPAFREERGNFKGNNGGQRRDFQKRDDRGPRKQGQGGGNFHKGPRPDNFGNAKPAENNASAPERNFNVEGASGENRFSLEGDRPFNGQQERKPHGKFFKKKFFNKDKKPGGGRKFG
jgi:ATP-dependent RNA helicase DeaD